MMTGLGPWATTQCGDAYGDRVQMLQRRSQPGQEFTCLFMSMCCYTRTPVLHTASCHCPMASVETLACLKELLAAALIAAAVLGQNAFSFDSRWNRSVSLGGFFCASAYVTRVCS